MQEGKSKKKLWRIGRKICVRKDLEENEQIKMIKWKANRRGVMERGVNRKAVRGRMRGGFA